MSHDIHTRNSCVSYTCRAGSVLANAVAVYCDSLFTELVARDAQSPCWYKYRCDKLDEQLGPDVLMGTLQRTADFIHPHLFLHWIFDLHRILQVQLNHYHLLTNAQRTIYAPLPQPFHIIDHLFNMFHFIDQFLDLPPSTWIHFVFVLNRVRTKYATRMPICSHTFIPLVWAVLLSVMKLDLDDHVDNIGFTNIVNFCLRPKTRSQSIRPSPSGKYTNAVLDKMMRDNKVLSTEQSLLVSHDMMNFFERVFLINVVEFDIMIPHDVHYFYCLCKECAPFHSIYYACAFYLRLYPVAQSACNEMECLCNPGVSVCQPIPSTYSYRLRSNLKKFVTFGSSTNVQIHWMRKLLSYEYVQFTEMFYKRVQMVTTQAPIGPNQAESSTTTNDQLTQSNPSSPTNPITTTISMHEFFTEPNQSTLIMT